MRIKHLIAGLALSAAAITGGSVIAAPTAQAAPLEWYGPVSERSGQASFWIVGTGPTNGWYHLARTGGIYRVVLQQKDENRYGPDSFNRWKTIAAIRQEERVGTRQNTWAMGWGARWADFRICRQESKWHNTRQQNRDCSHTVRMTNPNARPRGGRGGGGNGGGEGGMETGPSGGDGTFRPVA